MPSAVKHRVLTAVLPGNSHIIVVLICISQLANDTQQFFMCLLAVVYFFQGNVCSDPLPIF